MTTTDVQALAEVDVEVPAGSREPKMCLGRVGTIVTAQISGDAVTLRRTRRHIERCELASVQLVFMDQGRGRFVEDGRVADLEQGEFVLLDTRRPFEIDIPCRVTARVFEFPVAAIGRAEVKLHRLTASPLSQDHTLSAFLLPILGRLTSETATLHPQTRAQLAQNVIGVVATLINDRALDIVDDNGGRDALMLRIKSFIAKNLDRPELSPTLIATHHNISVRYLHKLFASEEVSLSRWILATRLERCRSDLARSGSARAPQVPVAVVANRWGFTSAPRFSRAFRSAYGMSPREWRDAQF